MMLKLFQCAWSINRSTLQRVRYHQRSCRKPQLLGALYPESAKSSGINRESTRISLNT